MTSIPESRSAAATTLAPRSWPSSPGFPTSTRILRCMPPPSAPFIQILALVELVSELRLGVLLDLPCRGEVLVADRNRIALRVAQLANDAGLDQLERRARGLLGLEAPGAVRAVPPQRLEPPRIVIDEAGPHAR